MAKIAYSILNMTAKSRAKVAYANQIIEEFRQQGFTLTLRQLYYQFVARDLIPNRVNEYKKLGELINNARMAGLIDWTAIEDRTRNLRSLSHWESPKEIIGDTVGWYARDLWADQKCQPEVWIEKDALVGVIQGVCNRNDVPYFSCRGYTSASEMHAAALRIIDRYRSQKQNTLIIHLGDHDPSGLDMTRDIEDRLSVFCHHHLGMRPFVVLRVALNVDQIEQYSPPPNPAKESDARFERYVEDTGFTDSWELDALSPTVIANLIETAIHNNRNPKKWDVAVKRQEAERETLRKTAMTL